MGGKVTRRVIVGYKRIGLDDRRMRLGIELGKPWILIKDMLVWYERVG